MASHTLRKILLPMYVTILYDRHPKSSQRPSFSQLVEMLSQAEFELFVWEEADLKDFDPQVKVIGAPLEVSQKLYFDLQNMYIQKLIE